MITVIRTKTYVNSPVADLSPCISCVACPAYIYDIDNSSVETFTIECGIDGMKPGIKMSFCKKHFEELINCGIQSAGATVSVGIGDQIDNQGHQSLQQKPFLVYCFNEFGIIMKKITNKNLFWLIQRDETDHLVPCDIDGVEGTPYLCGFWEEEIWNWPAVIVTTGESLLDQNICKKCLKIANSS